MILRFGARMKQTKSLYERLGGYDAIAALVTEHTIRQRADRRFSRLSGGRSADTKKRSLQLNIDYMCKITGGSNYYVGRDMKTAHAGLGITESEWNASMRHWEEALDKCKVSKKERGEFLALVGKTRKDIVEK
jgi:hemoglobin